LRDAAVGTNNKNIASSFNAPPPVPEQLNQVKNKARQGGRARININGYLNAVIPDLTETSDIEGVA
jgi:hypothetical protein